MVDDAVYEPQRGCKLKQHMNPGLLHLVQFWIKALNLGARVLLF